MENDKALRGSSKHSGFIEVVSLSYESTGLVNVGDQNVTCEGLLKFSSTQ